MGKLALILEIRKKFHIFLIILFISLLCRQITTTSTQSVTAQALDGGSPFL